MSRYLISNKKSISDNLIFIQAPGMFIAQLTCKAADAGGVVEYINTGRTKLPQTCICCKVAKKRSRSVTMAAVAE
jgi:transposase